MKQFFSLILSEGFRVFFLCAGLFAVFSMSLWTIYYFGGVAVIPTRMAQVQWHGHELVFGYGGAALGGFFLTAVPNWTGAKAAPQSFIGMVAALWLAGRFAIWCSVVIPLPLVTLIDLCFVPVLAVKIAVQLIHRPKPQNVVFLYFFSLFWVGNLMCHLDWLANVGPGADVGIRVGLLALAAMIVVLGGRVTPAFTRNAMHRAGIEVGEPRDLHLFTPVAIGGAALLPLSFALSPDSRVSGAVLGVVGLFALIRLGFWATRFQWTQPILWALHLGYGATGLGLLLWGLVSFGLGTEVAALHLLAIGGVGGMTLAVMSRAVLGHSGRALIAPKPVALAYGMIPLAAVLRWLGGSFGGVLYTPMVLAAGLVWCLAFALFVGALWPVFSTPRPPRAPAGAPPSS